MKHIKSIVVASALALSSFIPAANVSAVSDVTELKSYVSGSTIHVNGNAQGGTVAVAIEVYNEDMSTKLAGPETVNTNSEWAFSYDVAGEFTSSKTYTVCAANFDGGDANCQKTVKVIDSIEVTVKPPKIGDKVTLVDQGGYDWPDKEPNTSVSNSIIDAEMAIWVDENYDFFEGQFEANKDYLAMLDLTIPEGYIFANNLTVKIKGGGVLAEKTVWPNQRGVMIVAKIKPTVDGEELKAADTGIAPTQSNTKDAATRNISLGVSIMIASAILYGLHLFVKNRKNA